MKLGIAITTYNRRVMLLAMIEALRERTSQPFDLVVCDDGSSDGTREQLRSHGFMVLGGVNRGIAWNKNRALFYLREVIASDVMILLDDDIMPVEHGWERSWIAAVRRYGHMNHQPTGDVLLSGANTPENPGISEKLGGACIAFSRAALGYVGYMDTRFRGYGHEHTELTLRAIRAGFGGHVIMEAGLPRRFFYSIEGGIKILPNDSYSDPESIARNSKILELSDSEPIYRHAWRNEEEYQTLRAELSAVDGVPKAPADGPGRAVGEPPHNNLARGRPAMQSSRSRSARGATVEEDAAGAVSGQPNGRRNFETEDEEAPWWQVDLGEARAIAEVRLYNTLEPAAKGRFTRFVIGIAFDPDGWIEVCRKDDAASVGGVDGHPFIWRPTLSAFARFVRVTLIGRGALHLDQVEVFGPGRIDQVRLLPTTADAAPPPDAALFSPGEKQAMARLFFPVDDDRRDNPASGQAANLARGKPARQSSRSQWSRGGTIAEDAAGAVDGKPDGTRKFHTEIEDGPWWQVDLGAARTIAAVRIYNAVDPAVRRRFERFAISIAFEEGDDWIEVFRKDDEKEIGGINGNPFFWKPELSVFGRFLRVTGIGAGFLHLDQVEVFGPGEIPPPYVGPDGALFGQFISLGDNCELGVVQHETGVVSYDLLRYAGCADDAALITAMRERFSNFGTADDIEIVEDPLHEWQSGSRSCKVTFHTFRFSHEVDRATITARESHRLQTLGAKLVDDVRQAEKIFVRRAERPVGEETILALHRAMREIGEATLLWVSLADDAHPHGMVERVAPGLLRGYIRRMAPFSAAWDVRVEDWRDLCEAALGVRA